MEGGRIFFGLRQGGGVFLDAETYKPPAPQPVNSEPSLMDCSLFLRGPLFWQVADVGVT